MTNSALQSIMCKLYMSTCCHGDNLSPSALLFIVYVSVGHIIKLIKPEHKIWDLTVKLETTTSSTTLAMITSITATTVVTLIAASRACKHVHTHVYVHHLLLFKVVVQRWVKHRRKSCSRCYQDSH